MALATDIMLEPLESNPAAVGVTETFIPSNQTLFVAFIAAQTDLPNNEFMTVSGGGLTWTRYVHKSARSTATGGPSIVPGSAEIWTAFAATSPGSMAVTVTPSSDVFSYVCEVVGFTGSEGSRLTGQIGVASGYDQFGTTPLEINLGSVSPGSYVFAVSNDVYEVGVASCGAGTDFVYNSVGSHIWQTLSVLSSAGTQRMNLTAPSGQNYNGCAIEIKAARGGGASGSWL